MADPLRDELLKIVSKPDRDVVLSMDGIGFIDSSGFQTILAVVQRAIEMGSRFRICDVSQDVYELLKLMKRKVFFKINPVISKEYSPVV